MSMEQLVWWSEWWYAADVDAQLAANLAEAVCDYLAATA